MANKRTYSVCKPNYEIIKDEYYDFTTFDDAAAKAKELGAGAEVYTNEVLDGSRRRTVELWEVEKDGKVVMVDKA